MMRTPPPAVGLLEVASQPDLDFGNGALDWKRFPVGGLVTRWRCGECGAVFDQKHDAISYPDFGKPVEICGYCPDCDHEMAAPVILRATVTVENGADERRTP